MPTLEARARPPGGSTYVPAAAYTSFDPATAVSIALSKVAFGAAIVPGFESLPPGETKTAFAASPSIPSQFESTKLRSGLSTAPG
jgi:hypothetical protein